MVCPRHQAAVRPKSPATNGRTSGGGASRIAGCRMSLKLRVPPSRSRAYRKGSLPMANRAGQPWIPREADKHIRSRRLWCDHTATTRSSTKLRIEASFWSLHGWMRIGAAGWFASKPPIPFRQIHLLQIPVCLLQTGRARSP